MLTQREEHACSNLANPTSSPRRDGETFFLYFFFFLLLNTYFWIIACIRRSFPTLLASAENRMVGVRDSILSAKTGSHIARRERRPPTGLHNSLLQLLVCDSFAGWATWRTVACDRAVGFPFSLSLFLKNTRWLNYGTRGQNRAAILGSTLRAFEALTFPRLLRLSVATVARASDRKRGICMKRRISLIRCEDRRERSFSQSPIAINQSTEQSTYTITLRIHYRFLFIS